MRWAPRDHAAVVHAFLALLPTGEIWPRDPASVPVRVVNGLARVVARFLERAGQFLLIEAFPPHSWHLLPDWERVLGLPEECFPAAQTIPERRAAVLEKLRRRPGGQSRAYYVDLGRRLGYHEDGPSPYQLPLELPGPAGRLHRMTIEEFRPFMFGVSRLGDPEWGFAPPTMRFCWKVGIPGQRLEWFRFGESQCGVDHHLTIRIAEDLECILQKLKPAHTRLIFSYTGI